MTSKLRPPGFFRKTDLIANLPRQGPFAPDDGMGLADGTAIPTPEGWTVMGEVNAGQKIYAGIPQIKPTFLDIAPSGIPSNIIPHSKGIKCGLIRSNSPFSYSNHRPAKPKIPKPLVYAQVSPLGTSFATP